jgi:hypothetical protein
MLSHESSPATRAMNAPWAYPALYVGGNPFAHQYNPKMVDNYGKMIKRDTKKKPSRKKKVRKPDTSMDDFVREMELLKKDLAALADKKSQDRKTDKSKDEKPKKPVKAEVNDDLMKAAKTVFSNLKSTPGYYIRRDHVDRLMGSEKQPTQKKVSRQDASKIAKEIGIDFEKVQFSPEAFRKGIEAELRSDDRPTVVSRHQDNLGTDRVHDRVAGDRVDFGD